MTVIGITARVFNLDLKSFTLFNNRDCRLTNFSEKSKAGEHSYVQFKYRHGSNLHHAGCTPETLSEHTGLVNLFFAYWMLCLIIRCICHVFQSFLCSFDCYTCLPDWM